MTMNRPQLRDKFEAEYRKLNEQQRQAVDRLDGPVMVIAGPGTGKTQILASRIGRILLETDSLPENILCLTYTDAGVVAMRKRLIHFIGPDAYKVNIHTFHAFCNEVIQENLNVFNKNALDPVSELEQIALFRQLIDTLPKNNPLKRYRGDVYYEIKHLAGLFSTMKKEGWTPPFLNARIDEYLHQIEFDDTDYRFHYRRKYKDKMPGDSKPALEDEKERMEKLRAAVNEFDRYQALMEAEKLYDFDDMINWVIAAFETNKNLLARYQEQFLYVLVDEYQDTSGTQNRLVELLINYWDRPNVFVVGDDDQSIYRFQGANVENMMQFARAYEKDLLTVMLTSNYRSSQAILDVSKSLIERNQERLIRRLDGLSKDLIAANEARRQTEVIPRLRAYDTPRLEMIGITTEIARLISEGVDPGRVAVIYKENKYGEELARYFRVRQLPVYSKRSRNILELPLGRKLILLLRYVAAEHDVPYGGDEMLFEILHFDWFGIPAMEIAKISVAVAERQFGENRTSIRRMIYERSNEAPKDLFTVNIPAELKNAGQVLEGLISAVPNVTIQVLVEKMIREAGVLGKIMQSPDKVEELQQLNGFFDFIKETTRRKPDMSLRELVATIDIMDKEGIPLPLMQVSGSDKAVNLLTVHGSKGLEFEYVFFAGCNATYWEKKKKPGGGYQLPGTVFSSLTEGNREEELRRLFYVALTRAEQHLYLSYSHYRDDGKPLEPSMFIAEIQDQYQLEAETVTISSVQEAEFTSQLFLQEGAPEIEKAEEGFIDRILEKFVLSVTALNNFLKCPLEFYFRNLVRIPSPKNEATEFGSAVHYALEQLFRKMQDDEMNRFPGPEQFLSDFEWYMHRHRESFTREQFNRRLEYGREVLTNYYNTHIDNFNKIVAIERNIRNVVVRGVPLKGKLDKLEFEGKQVNVVDYKTGDPDKAREKMKGPSDKQPDGGDYWRQAVFYKILIDHYPSRDWNAVSTEFDFVEPDKKKRYRREKLPVSPADIETVSQQIEKTWKRIQARDFYTGCGKPDCHWCAFVKTNQMAVAVHELVAADEEGDD